MNLIRTTADFLEGRGVPRARLDTELMLADVLDTDRLSLYLQYDRPLAEDELARFRTLVRRRARREPLQYILGRAAFRHLALAVDRRCLIPRPETELLVGRVLEWARARPAPPSVVDVGTGTGAIALALASEGTFCRVVATDRSSDALEVARANAHSLGIGAVDFRVGDLFEPLAGERFDIVVSNPPYVAEGEWPDLQPEVCEWEPECALVAGPEGMDVLRPLVLTAGAHLERDGLLALEVGATQAAAVASVVRAEGGFGDPEVAQDLSGRDRMVLAHRRSDGIPRATDQGG